MPSFDREKPIEILERAEESRPEKGWGGTPPHPLAGPISEKTDLQNVIYGLCHVIPRVFFSWGGGCTGKDYCARYMDTE